MAKSKDAATNPSDGNEESLEDAFSGGASDASSEGGVFGAWQGGGVAAPAPTVPAPAPAPAAAASTPAVSPVVTETQQTVTADGREPFRKPVGFRVSVGVAKRLERFRKDKNLTVTEVVMLMADKSVAVMEEMLKYAVQGPKVQTSLFAPQGVAGPPKGTGSEQRQWAPRPEDRQVMAQLVEISGLANESSYIAAPSTTAFLRSPARRIELTRSMMCGACT
ncbi:hypothetical protein [Streptomyces halobius]|uniref:Uncharacterized protein n=1 Tax=Streptomyces halobius TaxID=2879846 RepID=A0ABY4MJD1_9ACTN|nr:hypothetical protein [Streptomyces halobius]UQA97462.1 hypothetical protein K9S39_41465 [Streptomyces halobius]